MLGVGTEQRMEGDAAKLQRGRCFCFPLPAESSPVQGTQWALTVERNRTKSEGGEAEATIKTRNRQSVEAAERVPRGQRRRRAAAEGPCHGAEGPRSPPARREGARPGTACCEQRGGGGRHGGAEAGRGTDLPRVAAVFPGRGCGCRRGGRARGGSGPRRRDFPGVGVEARRNPDLSNFPGQTWAGTTLCRL